MPRISAVVASFNSRQHLGRCLTSVLETVDEAIVVDSGSRDGSADLVREILPRVQVLEVANHGFGAAMNAGVDASTGDVVLLLNADTWAAAGAVEQLASCLDADQETAIVGPRLLNPDGSLQPSVRGFPTPWRLVTEYFFLRWFAPRSRALNAFYGAGFDHRSRREAEFLVGAVLLARRSAFEEVGGFDSDFFMFNEEVDLCYRLTQAGWRIVFCPGAEFTHVGGASTKPVWSSMYREQLRSHLRFLAKHRGPRTAERMRRVLMWSMRLRTVVFRGERRCLSRDTAQWLASASAAELIAQPRGQTGNARGPS
jgi:N-acetylglucosaminyl-diphospho-decaprenol L-rhamnosyltransferase